MPRATQRTHLAPDPSAEPLRVAQARGSIVTDERGREHVDFLAGWCVANLGWAHPDIQKRMRRYDGPDYVYPHYEHAPREELAARLADVAPGELARAFRATGGTEAVDIALQAAMLFTKRRKLVALDGCYHGNSLATLGLAGSAPQNLLATRRIKPPLDAKALARLETALKGRDVAALVMEPIPIALGVEVPADEFMEGAARLCRKYGTLLVLDEVATGFGRTGKLFAAEHFDVEPDMLCLAKGITSGHAPMGATLMTERVAKKVGDDIQAYSTYGWHPLAVEAALANLDVWERDADDILRNVEERGAQMRERLEELELGEVRQKGLAIAVKMESEKRASKLAERCRENGVLLTSSGEFLQMFPPLV
ncbi:MAG TPA: aspartate aminotransferase family protein, partial [Candidatus Thermoplasmatota archaeon]|nr:aspartate aminotransferase family protein [Candidatus Thermoplasmatota archaeon]